MVDHDPADDPTRLDVPAVDEPTAAMPAAAGGPPPVDPPPTGEPPAPPPDRRPWILAAVLGLIALVAIAALLIGGGDDDATVTTTTTEATTTTTEATTTTTEATTTTTEATTTTAAPPTTIDPARCADFVPNDPAPTAELLYEAYTVGDRACAEQQGTPDAVDTLFAIPGGGGGWTFEGCTEEEIPDPHLLCAYSFEGGSTGFRLNFSPTLGWVVYEVFQVAD
jgi:hypothetical protein